MMPDIFSSFDPFMFNTLIPSNSIFLCINVLLILFMQSSFWIIGSQKSSFMNEIVQLIYTQLSRTNTVHLKGLSSLVSAIFVAVILINLFGLIPYMFSTSSHLIFTLTIGLPIWLSMVLSSFTKSFKASVAHFLPDGAPDWLNPFLVLIETTSITVRPLTLSFRLAANMSAGHIVLSLVGIYCAASLFTSTFGAIMLLSVSIGYLLFEVAICMIQAYIFCLLLSLYSDDHAHVF
uniref:ATP synthase subunit a n=1 Tax=Mesenchytraeus cf. gelidus SL-2017 TaxID=2052679 RepID=A0A286KAQ8_9ANNE|nr:ATP synthase subunit 6 [Mesenchytraeus cf. gelidus SL-2017]